MKRKSLAFTILTMLGAAVLAPAENANPIPRLVKKDGRYALMVDGAPFLVLGAQANNSSAWPAMLPKVWSAIEYLHANTLEIPIYWEQFEPRPGQYDYSVIDAIINQARERKVRLVLLWFGTWKNGSQHYMPEWMKRDPGKYAHLIDKNSKPADSPSPFAQASLEADIRAFTEFMKHLKAYDPQRTVIMVQVQNEPGTWGPLRDYSPAAEELYRAPVPADILKAMGKQGVAGDWETVFGPESEVCFHAWSVARYIQQVAAAGKAVYPLPMYVNAALRDPIKPGAPGSYESGGPTDNVIPIYKVAAPAIDFVSPDIYMRETEQYLKVLDLYRREDNALFVPETTASASFARFLFSVIGRQGIGYAPFGLDHTRSAFFGARAGASPDEFLDPTAQNYKLLGPMMREIAKLNFDGKLQAVVEEKDKPTQTLHFRPWDVVISYGVARNGPAKGNTQPIGRMLVGQLKEDQYLLAGFFARVDFTPDDTNKKRQFIRVEEGKYENGEFKFVRILNGDQTDWGLNFGSEPSVLRVTVATY
jgi:hypothetical protein